MWGFQLSKKIYLSGEVEPVTAEKIELARDPDEEHMEADSLGLGNLKNTLSAHGGELAIPVPAFNSQETNEKENFKKSKTKGDKKPLLICPNCYQFKPHKKTPANSLAPPVPNNTILSASGCCSLCVS